MPDAPPPESLRDLAEIEAEMIERMPHKATGYFRNQRPFEFRAVNPLEYLKRETRPAARQVWFRVVGEMPGDQALHRCLLTYVSDYHLLVTATLPRHPHLRRAVRAAVQRELRGGARARTLMKNIMYAGTLAALIDLDLEVIRGLLAETFAKKPALVDSNMKAIEIGHRYAREHFECPLPIRVERLDATRGHVMIDGNTAAALGCLYAGATVGAWYPITPSTSLMDAFRSLCARHAPIRKPAGGTT